MKDRPQGAGVSRRRFVTLMAAGSAALVAAPLAAAESAAPALRRKPPIGKPPMKPKVPAEPIAPVPNATDAERAEIARQKQSTLDMLAVIRKHAMPPGTEMAASFRVLRSTRKGG